MKFTIKHALVVAVCALCVCVVATGTVVAVTVSRAQTEAATQLTGIITLLPTSTHPAMGFASTTVRYRAWGSGEVEGTLRERASFSFLPGNSVFVSAGDGLGIRGVAIQAAGVWTYEDIPLTQVTPRPPMPRLAAAGLHFTRIGNNDGSMMIDSVGNLNDITVRMWIAPRRYMVVGDSDFRYTITRVVRSAATGTATTTVVSEFGQGFHAIPEPANQLATFRGWALEAGGTLLFPRGLPVPVFSTKRLYAVHV